MLFRLPVLVLFFSLAAHTQASTGIACQAHCHTKWQNPTCFADFGEDECDAQFVACVGFCACPTCTRATTQLWFTLNLLTGFEFGLTLAVVREEFPPPRYKSPVSTSLRVVVNRTQGLLGGQQPRTIKTWVMIWERRVARRSGTKIICEIQKKAVSKKSFDIYEFPASPARFSPPLRRKGRLLWCFEPPGASSTWPAKLSAPIKWLRTDGQTALATVSTESGWRTVGQMASKAVEPEWSPPKDLTESRSKMRRNRVWAIGTSDSFGPEHC
ncbi:hypothetical protein C8F04DRAFT_1238609 [Mycena alexandri]|uniref:Secreted protein n=1 Tax=Mycena alexandri TaxID=1745969 RepID=A0AAD6SFC9_9AGAR|nr:hypothetical protein C8F04DRAFT_1238609 [Mycena alexandri]